VFPYGPFPASELVQSRSEIIIVESEVTSRSMSGVTVLFRNPLRLSSRSGEKDGTLDFDFHPTTDGKAVAEEGGIVLFRHIQAQIPYTVFREPRQLHLEELE